MADFVAVIRRAVDGLSDKSPAMRARVYDKARTAVRRQLEGMNPRPSDAAIAAQLAKLESAVESVEAEFVVPELSIEDLAIDEPAAEAPPSQAEPQAAEWQPASPEPEPEPEPYREQAAEPEPEPAPAVEPEPTPEPEPEPEPVAPTRSDDRTGKPTVAPVPFGSYAMGRAPSFSTRTGAPSQPAERPADGFVPSRYQTDFGAQKPAQPTVTQPLVPLSPAHDAVEDREADARHVEAAEPVAASSLPTDDTPAPSPAEAETTAETPEPVPAAEPVEPIELASEPVATEPSVQQDDPATATAGPAAGYSDAARQPEPDIIFEDAPRQTPAATPEAFFEDELRRQEAAEAPQASADAVTAATGAAAAAKTEAAEGWHDNTFGFDTVDEPLTERAAKPASRRSKQKIVGAAEPKRRRFGRGALVALVALLIVLGAGYAAWTNQDEIVALFSGDAQQETAEPAETGTEAPDDVAALPGDQETTEPAAAAGGDKFTQRLLSDGTEIDDGPAQSAEQPQPGEEGRSISAQSQPSADPAPGEDAEITENAIAESAAANPAEVAEAEAESEAAAGETGPAVGQTMFLYEERLGSLGPTAIEGSVVWSIVNESPGGDAQPEEAIRAEIDIPEKDLTALMTIRRNADASLPASHLIEIVFSLPATFEGGGIETVQRVAFKESEQDRGNELIAVPARITDDFFMVALNDYAEAVETNTTLMRDRNWIDIPVVYGNGRRALITLEKGSAGIEVFNQALAVWQRRLGGTAGQ